MTLPDIQDWIDRLRSEAPILEEVGGSQALADRLAQREVVSPSAYVVLASEEPGENEIDAGTSQQTTQRVAVVILVHNLVATSETGGDAALRDARAAIFNALLAWAPSACDPVEYDSGQRVSAIDANLVVWQDDFATQYLLRAV